MEALFRNLMLLQRQAQQSLADAFGAASAGGGAEVLLLLLLAGFFGMVHAVGPGHGKSVMVAYFAGQEAKARHGLTASLKLIATHVGSAILLVLGAVLVLEVSFGFRPADFPLVRQISYAGVAGVGVYLLVCALRGSGRDAQGHSTGGRLLPYVAGLVPCPLTTIILLAAIGRGALVLGLVVSVAMALGMILTLTIFTLAAILARKWLVAAFERHMAKLVRVARAFEIAGAVAVVALGALLFVGELA